MAGTFTRPAIIGPDNPSSDHCAMQPYLTMVDTILGGIECMREAGKRYLPQFPNESDANYEHRRRNSKMTNVFKDVVENLAAKPFAKECTLFEQDKAPERIKAIAEDVDGRGNNMHVFASRMFYNGIAKASDWLLVDYPKVSQSVTRAEEKQIGARPYWVHVPAENLIAVYTDQINGKEEVVHARILEPSIERQGYDEVCVERVRVLDREPIYATDKEGQIIAGEIVGYQPATFSVYQKVEKRYRNSVRAPRISWELREAGPISIGVIALVPFATGRRFGSSQRYLPALKDCADLQIELYQEETNLKLAKEQSCFPMYAGNGINPPLDKEGKPLPLPTGPGAAVYAPMTQSGDHGEWAMLEPNAQSLKFVADESKETAQKIRELGRQPLTAQTGNLTVVTTAFAAQKGNSACQSWALLLKDALEQAWYFTGLWLKESYEAQVQIFTDFSIENEDGSSMQRLIDMAKINKLSNETLWEEAKRRGELSAEHDADRERDRLAEQGPDPLSEADLAAALTPKGGKKPPPGKPPAKTPEKIAA